MKACSPLSRRAFAGLMLAAPAVARAQAQPAWPTRPVRLVNTGGPGSGIDLIARLLSEGLASRLGQPFPVENKPGADGILAGEAHAQARPGESLLLCGTGLASVVPLLRPTMPFAAEALAPVATTGREFMVLVVPGNQPVREVPALLAQARAQPGHLAWFAVSGLPDLAFRLFLRDQGLEMTYVAYRASPPAALDLAAGRIQAALLPLTPVKALLQNGRLRALAVASRRRAPDLPEVPTTAEAGCPGLLAESVIGLFGWPGLAPAGRQALAAATGAVLAEPASANRLLAAGILPAPDGPAALAEVVASQQAQARAAIAAVGLPAG